MMSSMIILASWSTLKKNTSMGIIVETAARQPPSQGSPGHQLQVLQEYLDYNQKMSLSDIPDLFSYLEEKVTTLDKIFISVIIYDS